MNVCIWFIAFVKAAAHCVSSAFGDFELKRTRETNVQLRLLFENSKLMKLENWSQKPEEWTGFVIGLMVNRKNVEVPKCVTVFVSGFSIRQYHVFCHGLRILILISLAYIPMIPTVLLLSELRSL